MVIHDSQIRKWKNRKWIALDSEDGLPFPCSFLENLVLAKVCFWFRFLYLYCSLFCLWISFPLQRYMMNFNCIDKDLAVDNERGMLYERNTRRFSTKFNPINGKKHFQLFFLIFFIIILNIHHCCVDLCVDLSRTINFSHNEPSFPCYWLLRDLLGGFSVPI